MKSFEEECARREESKNMSADIIILCRNNIERRRKEGRVNDEYFEAVVDTEEQYIRALKDSILEDMAELYVHQRSLVK